MCRYALIPHILTYISVRTIWSPVWSLITSSWHHRKRTCMRLIGFLLDQLRDEQGWLISYSPQCVPACDSPPLFFPQQNNSHSLCSCESSPPPPRLSSNKTHRVLTHIFKGLLSLTQQYDNNKTKREREWVIDRERMRNVIHPGTKMMMVLVYYNYTAMNADRVL